MRLFKGIRFSFCEDFGADCFLDTNDSIRTVPGLRFGRSCTHFNLIHLCFGSFAARESESTAPEVTRGGGSRVTLPTMPTGRYVRVASTPGSVR